MRGVAEQFLNKNLVPGWMKNLIAAKSTSVFILWGQKRSENFGYVIWSLQCIII